MSGAPPLWFCNALALASLFGCGARSSEAGPQRTQSGAAGAECAGRARAGNPLPGVRPEETTLRYWLSRYDARELDNELMSREQVEAYNARVGRRLGRDSFSQRDLRVPIDGLQLADDVRERLAFFRPDLSSGELVARDGKPLAERAQSAFGETPKLQTPSLRVLLEPTLVRCGPYDGGLFKPDLQLSYDRNACGNLRPQEVVELLGRTAEGMWLIRSRSAFGFLSPGASLSPQLPAAYEQAFLEGPRLYALQDVQLPAESGPLEVPGRTTLPLLERGDLVVASARGYARVPRAPQLVSQARPLTRRALFTAAFAELNKPYGLGGAGGGFDCSSLLLELFDGFDIALPRFSGWQAEGGSFSVDLRRATPGQKLERLDLAAQSGAVLLFLPGHVMLYLGRDDAGEPMAIHALGEYLEPCEAGETIVDVQRVVVSHLQLGKNSSRGSFLERITKLVVFGGEPASALTRFVKPGPAAPPDAPRADASCSDSEDNRIFVAPAQPEPGKPVTAIVTSPNAPGTATLRIYAANGDAVPIDEFGLGGPPHARVARATKLRAGTYSAVYGSGTRKLACRRFRVRGANISRSGASEGDPIWEPRPRWEREHERLYAIFVEQLFSGPPDDEQTWTNLHSMLRDPSRNLLYNYLGRDEESQLQIQPDCADLPYALRAYFAWKMRLPFAFRPCSRGRAGKPPSCGEMRTSLMPRQAADDVVAFDRFVNRAVRNGVHSATGRTAPDDSASDLYPVALDRSALTPGTVYADPYGHVMMVSKWFAQGSVGDSPYGVLMAAEAQPDGTIGRRRFWQGSFLFDPNTANAGAGFKRFRPLQFDKSTGELTALDNRALESVRDYPRFSTAQYRGSKDDFYDRMDELINPTPLAPRARMLSLVDALEEAARRRVLSVDNGEQYAKQRPHDTISMPQGYAIFETAGAWEDFATPSRDMRLLIAIDTVDALPGRVRQKPERFSLPAGRAPAAAADELTAALQRELRSRSFQYTRSDGSAQTLTLADVVERSTALEVAYNPNDCAEVRWGAPLGSPERTTCMRSAPPAQQSRMQSYRSWFKTRTRPARGE